MNTSNASNYTQNFSHGVIFEGDVDDSLFHAYRIYYFIIDTVFILPTICGNAMILVAIWRFSGLRKSTSFILIGNLAVSDLLVGAVVFPINMLLLQDKVFTKNVKICLLQFSLIFTLIGASVMNLFLLSLERYHAITRPLTHAVTCTKTRIYFAIAFTWILAIILGFLPLAGRHQSVEDRYFICGTTPVLSEVYTKIICTVIVLSLIANGIFFFIIVHVAMKSASSFTDINVKDKHHKRTRRNIRHTKMMLIVSGLFIVFWGPFCVLTLIPAQSDIMKLVTAWAGSLGLINSSLNWIVYGVRSNRFRIAFKAILTCGCEKAEREISSLST